MKQKNQIKGLLDKEFSCNVSVLKDCVEENDFFSIFFNAKIRIKKISRKHIIVEILNKEQQIEYYYFNIFLDCMQKNQVLDVVLNDKFQIISIKKACKKSSPSH